MAKNHEEKGISSYTEKLAKFAYFLLFFTGPFIALVAFFAKELLPITLLITVGMIVLIMIIFAGLYLYIENKALQHQQEEEKVIQKAMEKEREKNYQSKRVRRISRIPFKSELELRHSKNTESKNE